MTIKVPRGDIEEELAAVRCELDQQPSSAYIPSLFLKLGLETIRIVEKTLHLDCGPTAGSEAAFMARSRALDDSRAIAGWRDMRSAIYATVTSAERQHEGAISEESLDSLLPDIATFLQSELAGIDLALLIKNLYTTTASTGEITAASLKRLIAKSGSAPELEKFSSWVTEHEKIANFRIYDVIADYLQTYRTGIAQLKKARGRLSN
jgi:hypothetical protein